MSYQASYKYECELSLNYKNNETKILKEYVRYIITQYDYKNRAMPIIYIRLSLPASIYNKMVPLQQKAKIYLKVYRFNAGGTSYIPKSCIYDEFDYYMSEDPNSFKKLDEVGEEYGGSYRVCTIGLLKTSLINQNKRKFEGIYKDTNPASLVKMATSNIENMVIEPFNNNPDIKNINVPPITTIGQFLSFINAQYNFYNGPYTYFMDFDRTYLMSNEGNYIDMKDGTYQFVAIDIRDRTSDNTKMQGMVIDDAQKSYIIYVDGSDVTISSNKVAPQLSSNITAVDIEGNTNTVKIDTSELTNVEYSDESESVVRSDDNKLALAISSLIEKSSGAIYIQKTDIDSRVLTPNKQYLLANYEDNPKYCGKYYLISKEEIYVRTGENLKCIINLGIKKCSIKDV